MRSGFASDNAKKQRDRAFPMIQENRKCSSERFAADLADERDVILSRCAALMAIKFLVEERAL